MTKYLTIVECDKITVRRMRRGSRQMVSVNGRLYRTDDDIMIRDIDSGDAMAIYPVDDTQPLHPAAPLVDPDMTRALIDSAKIGGNKKRIWVDLDDITGKVMQILAAIIIIGALVMSFLG